MSVNSKIIKDFQLKKLIGKKKFVLCHGTFDIVHPGHLRQFRFAKKFSEILVVSLTGDEFIRKGNLKPYISQTLRASNLAEMQIVDYVIIDQNIEPLNLIKKIKPTFYIKGFEYSHLDNIKTKREIEVLKKNGGKIIFSPGDEVFSSTYIQENSKPKLKFERLRNLLSTENIEINDCLNVINKFKNKKVLIVGDSIVDKYNNCIIVGGMHKSPTLSVKIQSSDLYVGGAAIVAMHLASAGADVTFSTILGNDLEGEFLISQLKKTKIKLNLVIVDHKPTTLKEVMYCQKQKLLKIDRVDNALVANIYLDKLFEKHINNVDMLVISDFRHGIFNKYSLKYIQKFFNKKLYKVADTQVASRWGNLTEFHNYDLLTPNEREIRFALADQDTVLRPLGRNLMKEVNCKNLFIKLGENGVMSIRNYNTAKKPSILIDSMINSDQVVDPVGSGDAFLAYSSLAMNTSKNDLLSCLIGSIAAGISCSTIGNIPITRNEVEQQLKKLRNIFS